MLPDGHMILSEKNVQKRGVNMANESRSGAATALGRGMLAALGITLAGMILLSLIVLHEPMTPLAAVGAVLILGSTFFGELS